MDTRASNPGEIRIDRWRLLRYEPVWPIVLILSVIGLFYLGLTGAGAIYIGSGSFGILVVWIYIATYFRLREMQFAEGDVNISKVISLDPPLLATSTNMQTGFDSNEYPVVKIVRGKVPAARGRRWKAGDYFASACLYIGPHRKPRWKNVFPLPISLATDRIEVIEEQDRRVADLREELDRRLSLVPTPRRPGLYFLDAARLAALRGKQREGT